jgi:hypothetical protein
MRAFPANPEKLPDGTWRDNTGGMHAFFRVERGLAEKFYETMRRDFEQGFGFDKGKMPQVNGAKAHTVARL